LSIFLATLAMGISASLKTTSEYQATAKVLIRREEGSSFQKMRSPYLGLEEEMNTEIEILKSTPVLQRALDEVAERLRDLPVEERAVLFPPEDPELVYEVPGPRWIRKNIQAEPIEKSNVIMIRLRHTNPATAKMIVDAVTASYVVERISVRRNPMLESFFEDRTAGLRDRLLDFRLELGPMQVESGIYDQEWQQRLNLGTLDELRTNLLTVRIRRETEEAKLRAARHAVMNRPDLLVPTREFEDSPAFQDLRTKLIDKKATLADLSARYLPGNPKVQHALSLVHQLETDLREEIDLQLAMHESDIESLRAHERALAGAVKDVVQEMNRIPQFSPVIRQLEREINNTAELYELVGTKMVDTQISETEDHRMVNAKILNPATVGLSFVQERKSLFALFAALLGLSLGLALAFLIEGMDQTFRTPHDVETSLNVPLLGSIPELGSAQP
ncbi:MAG: hypothetical protein QGH59_03915, partial [Gemmatimonadota bacterium]|nr:hypothetical protein [Gemmatimonadota bacterium]